MHAGAAQSESGRTAAPLIARPTAGLGGPLLCRQLHVGCSRTGQSNVVAAVLANRNAVAVKAPVAVVEVSFMWLP